MEKQTVQLNYLRIPPRKVRAVAGLVRGMSVNEAEAQLMYERRRAAKPLLKLLRSAVSAAKTTKKLNPEKLVVEQIFVDQGPMLKRSLPRARGVASLIQKKMSHVTLTLVEHAEGKPTRFSIVIKKKAKKTEEEKGTRKGKKRTEAPQEEQVKRPDAKPGFFKRFFRRKSV